MGREKGRKPKRADKVKWPGVYQYENEKRQMPGGKPDVTYYITYKITHKDRLKKVWEKIGMKSEGITPMIADDIRKERTLKARHGEEVLTAKQIKKKREKTNKTLDAVADEYFKQRGGSVRAGQFDLWRYNKHVKPVIGHRLISSLTVLDVKRIENAMQGAAPATVWGALELVRRISNFGKRAKLTDGLTFIIKMPKRDNEVVEFLTPEQAGSLLQTLDTWKRQDVACMLKVAMFSGLRRGEIFKLENCDIDFQNKTIRLRTPKGGKTVSIPMNPIIEGIIKEQIIWRDRVYPGSEILFPNTKGTARVDCSAVDRIRDKADLPSRFRMFHGLRHHFAVTLANSGEFTLDMIGELLTHKSHEMTKRYASFLPGSLKKASDRAAELLGQQVVKADLKEAAK